jgi:predicted phosphate transport protein (TIGR00153 family)
MGSGGGFLSWIRSSDREIIDALEQQGANVLKAASALVDLVSNFNNVSERKVNIKDIEHTGDQIAHSIYLIMDKTFVTPLDREDISKLTSEVDEILDYIDGAADRFVLFKITKPTPYMIELAKILLSATQEVHLLLTRLRGFKNSADLIEHCRNISKYEHEADTIYRLAIAELFETSDAVEIIKFKEIYLQLEDAVNRCQDVADTFEDIGLKYG